jgi:hypothetical protein
MLHYYNLILTGNQTSYYIYRFWGGIPLIQYFHRRHNSEDPQGDSNMKGDLMKEKEKET